MFKLATNPSILKQYVDSFNWGHILHNLTFIIIDLVLVSIFFLIIKLIGQSLVNHLFGKYLQKEKKIGPKREGTLKSIATNTFNYILEFFWLYSVLTVIGIPVGSLLAGAGLLTVALGLGAQGLANDIITGFFILFEHQIDVGDFVVLDTITGTVEEIGLRSTQIRGVDDSLNFVPNRYITNICNMSKDRLKAEINIRVNPNSPIQQIIDIVKEVNAKNIPITDGIIDEPQLLGTVDLGDGTIAVKEWIPCKDTAKFTVQFKFLQLYLEAINDAGITLPNNKLITPIPQK
ncbi:MAG: mechanosensitive ion channel family protein [Apilactobacillus sp.]|uniref:mechanosensitive ion channel family protein n=2 Tax=Apilactobacillus TaxID=2767877 RepID=UPI0030EAAA8C|nr:mechanosensitive ion channel family protein [Apilactobacillus sp.]